MKLDYCKGQMRVHVRVDKIGSPTGLVNVYVFVCPVCRKEYGRKEAKQIHLTLKCSALAREREEIAA